MDKCPWQDSWRIATLNFVWHVLLICRWWLCHGYLAQEDGHKCTWEVQLNCENIMTEILLLEVHSHGIYLIIEKSWGPESCAQFWVCQLKCQKQHLIWGFQSNVCMQLFGFCRFWKHIYWSSWIEHSHLFGFISDATSLIGRFVTSGRPCLPAR